MAAFVPSVPVGSSSSSFVSSKLGTSFLGGSCALSMKQSTPEAVRQEITCQKTAHFSLSEGVERLVEGVSRVMKPFIGEEKKADFSAPKQNAKFETFADPSIGLLSHPKKAISARLADEASGLTKTPKLRSTSYDKGGADVEDIIESAYRQVFGAEVTFAFDRSINLDSFLRDGKITVKEFVKGLVKSESFKSKVYEPNTNYRFVEIMIQRLLGRDSYNKEEEMAWAVVIGSKGYDYFVDKFFDSEEYMSTWGDNSVPYQRARVLAPRSTGDIPFALRGKSRDSDGWLDYGVSYSIGLGGISDKAASPKLSIPQQFVKKVKKNRKFAERRITFYSV